MSGGGGGERSSLSNLKAELRNLKEENMLSISQNTQLALANSHLQASLSHSITNIQAFKFGANLILENDRKTCFYVYTGLPTYKVFRTLFDLHPYHSFLQRSVPNIDHFFATLVYLHLHTPVEDLAPQLQISQPNVSCMFHSWIETMYHNLQPLVTWPDTETLQQNMPDAFRKHFSRVKCIVDCFEIFTERPLSFQARGATYSNYKKHNTVKVFIAVSPTGAITFISKACTGRVSDSYHSEKRLS